MKIYIKEFQEFCKKNVSLIIFDLVIVGLVFGCRIFTSNISIDTDLLMSIPNYQYNWLDIGRWGLILFQNIFSNSWFNLYVNGTLAFLAIVSFLVLYSFLFDYVKSGQKLNYYIFSALFITHPIFSMQWWFRLQSFEIALSICCIPISIFLLFEWIENNKKSNLITGIVFMILSFACYQTNVILFIASTLFCYLLKYGNLEKIKDIWNICFKLISSFLIGFIINTLITKLFFTSSEYLNDTVLWGKESLFQCIKNILVHCRDVLLGYSVVMSKAYIFALVILLAIFIFAIIKHRKIKIFSLIVLISFTISPFLLSIYMGNIPAYRSQYTLPFVIAGLYTLILLFLKQNDLKIEYTKYVFICLSVFFVLMQVKVTERIWYTEDVRYEQDCLLLDNIISDMRINGIDYETKKTVFIGKYDVSLNPSCFENIDLVGLSYFSAFTDAEPTYFYSNANIHRFAKLRGIKTNGNVGSYEISEAISKSEDMKSYPQKGYIKETEDLIIIKLSD